jgi:hypothetical protein
MNDSKLFRALALAFLLLSALTIAPAMAQSNKCGAGIGNWSYRYADPYLKKTFASPELRLQGISNWGELQSVGQISNRFDRCDHNSHKRKIVPNTSMIMSGVFVSGEICSDSSTLIFEQGGDDSLANSTFRTATPGSYEHNKARNVLASWYYPYQLGGSQKIWNRNREIIILYTSYLSNVCETLPERVRVEARTNISRGPNGPQKPTTPFSYDVLFTGEFHPNSGRVELHPNDEEMQQRVLASLEQMWRNQTQQLVEFQRRLDAGFAFVALGVAGIHMTSECNQFPIGHPDRPPLCD